MIFWLIRVKLNIHIHFQQLFNIKYTLLLTQNYLL